MAKPIWPILNLLTRETQHLTAQKRGCSIKKKLKSSEIFSPRQTNQVPHLPWHCQHPVSHALSALNECLSGSQVIGSGVTDHMTYFANHLSTYNPCTGFFLQVKNDLLKRGAKKATQGIQYLYTHRQTDQNNPCTGNQKIKVTDGTLVAAAD